MGSCTATSEKNQTKAHIQEFRLRHTNSIARPISDDTSTCSFSLKIKEIHGIFFQKVNSSIQLHATCAPDQFYETDICEDKIKPKVFFLLNYNIVGKRYGI